MRAQPARHAGSKREEHFPAQVEPPTLGVAAKGSAGADVISGGAGGVGQVELLTERRKEGKQQQEKLLQA